VGQPSFYFALSQGGVDGDETPAERVHAEPEGLQRLRAEQLRRARVGEKRQHRPFAPLEADPDFRDGLNRRLSGGEDDPLRADGPVAQAIEHTGRERQVGRPGVHQNRLMLARSTARGKHFQGDAKETHGGSQTNEDVMRRKARMTVVTF